jgi:hypothetical protein
MDWFIVDKSILRLEVCITSNLNRDKIIYGCMSNLMEIRKGKERKGKGMERKGRRK